MKTILRPRAVLLLAGFLAICFSACAVKTTPVPKPPTGLRAGLRSSPYGPKNGFPNPAYWQSSARSMASRFTGAIPALVWIVGTMESDEAIEPEDRFTGRCKLSFPSPGGEFPDIVFSDADANEAYLEQFDRNGYQVWLQVEPANADVETLIKLVLDRYGKHSCVIGFGIDVEWHRWSRQNNEGTEVSDIQARAWSERVRKYDPGYRLFLKHWLDSKMPASYRQGLAFISDSQEFTSLEQMLADFEAWGKAFAPVPVGFQFGYPFDGAWWRQLADPPAAIGRAILARIPNTSELYWVDFTMQEIWPEAAAAPEKN
ncbi:MAG TPA: hypothetical protein VMZ49_12630 [Patescibacteria group bacterium]|nr:hypothetical protein [Patescibacteria group bacterium]